MDLEDDSAQTVPSRHWPGKQMQIKSLHKWVQEHDELRPMKWDANAASVLHCDLVKGKDALREGKAAPANQGRFLEYVAGQYRPNKGSVSRPA